LNLFEDSVDQLWFLNNKNPREQVTFTALLSDRASNDSTTHVRLLLANTCDQLLGVSRNLRIGQQEPQRFESAKFFMRTHSRGKW